MNLTKIKKFLAAASLAIMMCFAFAGCSMMGGTTGTSGTAATGAGAGGTIQLVLSMVVLFAVFYFFMIRPEKKRKKKIEEMRSSLGVGDPIVTIGGMKGKIVSMSDDSITFETGEDRVRIEVAKWAISRKAK